MGLEAQKNDPFLSLYAQRPIGSGPVAQGDIYWQGVPHAHYVLARCHTRPKPF